MTRLNRNPRRRGARSGFTLLEILLVVGLLALLATFVLPALSGSGEKAKIKLAEAAVGPSGNLARCVDLYKFDVGQFPEELKDLADKPGDSDAAEKWNGPYIKDISGLQDPWGHEYQYNRESKYKEGSYDIWSMGPDGVDGTDDDVKSWKDDR